MLKVNKLFLPVLIAALGCASSRAWGQASSSDVYYATNYSGEDASVKINACIAAVIAAHGGVCDAGGLGLNQKMSQEIDLGTTASSASRIGISLLLPETAVWVWHLTDGTSCGIRQFSSTSLLGHQPAGGGNRMVLAASSGSQMDAIYCTDAPSNGSNYVRAEGFAVWNNQPGSTFANGVVHIRDAADQSRFIGIFAENYYGDVWHVDSACCGTTFEEIQGTSNGTTRISNGSSGGIPLTVGPGKLIGVSFHNSGFNAPGIGSPDIMITSESPVTGISFYDTYMEGNGRVDDVTPMVYIGPNVGPVHFVDGFGDTGLATPSATKSIFENHGFYLDIPSFQTANAIMGINDVTAGVKISVSNFSANLGTIRSYQTQQTHAAARSR